MSFIDLLKKFLEFKGEEKRLFFSIAFLLPLVALVLRVSNFTRFYSWLEHLAGDSKRQGSGTLEDDRTQIFQLRRTLEAVRKHSFYAGNCLSRSLLLWFLLRRRGIICELRFGVKKSDTFQAHAWVEYQGKPINVKKNIRDRYLLFDKTVLPKEMKFL
jgi:hypothetical protein